MPTYIDANGNLCSSRPPEVASLNVDGREVLLREQQQRAQQSQQPQQEQGAVDPESGRANAGGFQCYGFPGFKWRSAVGVIVALQILMYFVSLWVVTPRAVMNPSGLAMFKIGSSNAIAEMCAVRESFPRHLLELRRWLVPIFLHASPLHIGLNLYFECSAGPAIEARDSAPAFALLFFGAGLMGNLLSDAMGVNGVGGSTACYGIIGMTFAMAYRRWPEMELEERESMKRWAMQTCGMLLLWELMLWKEIDHFGHLGGFLGGFLIVVGRVDRRFLAAFVVLASACIYVICIKPLGKQEVNGHPWQAVCNGVWASYAH